MSKNRKILVILLVAAAVCAALVSAVVFGIRVFRERARQMEFVQERRLLCERLGIHFDGARALVPLPLSVFYNEGRARLGLKLVTDPRLVGSRWRMCCACHRPETGGSDQKVHAGLLTRPLSNAVLGSVFLHDGYATNIQQAVRTMIEDPRFGAGGTLSNVVARLTQDEALVARFQMVYGAGPAETNVLDAIEHHLRTRLLPRNEFDSWCLADGTGFDAKRQQGAEIFVSHKCTDCHDGPSLGALRTWKGKKVTGLRGLSRRNVHLSDGSRADLGAVLAMMPGGEVDEEQRAALVAFLKTL